MILTKENIQKTKGKFQPKAILILCDEMSEVMNDSNYKMVNSISNSLGSIARLGRAAGVHLCLATQRPSSNVINADLKNNIQMSCLLGDFDTGASSLLFDKDISYLSKPEIKGRGFLKSGKEIYEFQSFWTEKEKDFILRNNNNNNALEIENKVEIEDNDAIDNIKTEENLIPGNNNNNNDSCNVVSDSGNVVSNSGNAINNIPNNQNNRNQQQQQQQQQQQSLQNAEEQNLNEGYESIDIEEIANIIKREKLMKNNKNDNNSNDNGNVDVAAKTENPGNKIANNKLQIKLNKPNNSGNQQNKLKIKFKNSN